jgi:hypothetical protein
MNKILLSSIVALASAGVTLSVSAKASEDKVRQGRASVQASTNQSLPSQSEQKSSSNRRVESAHGNQGQTNAKHHSHNSSQHSSGQHSSSHYNQHRYDPATEMRRALKHLWKEHRYQDSYGRRKRNDDHHEHGRNMRSKGKHSSSTRSANTSSSRSYNSTVSRFQDDPHFVRYYDNDFYVYLNDRYYQDHFRGPWWGHYHRGDYCRTKHNYLMHDDVRNLLMLGLVIDLVSY